MKINLESIEGYRADMTAEEKLELLLGYDIPKSDDGEPKISKRMYDKLSSEFAELKRQYKGKLTEEENAEEERKQREQQIEEELKILRRDKTVSGYKDQFITQGYEPAIAMQAAEALEDGDMAKYFELSSRHAVMREKALRADILKGTPKPPAGDNSNADADDKAVELAKQIGRSSAESNKAANDIVAKYM